MRWAGAEFSWESSDIAVATVDESGLVTGVAEGVATITASAGEASGSAVVTVTQSVASVVVSPSTAELAALGETVQLTAEAFDENGHAVAGAEFSWESSDVAVATVDESGLVTGVAEGVATITASAGEASGSAVVTVTQPVASVVVSPATAELTALGETVQLTAEAFDENGHAVAGAEFSWESSDVAVATVDESGLVTGVAEGVATITASAGEASGSAVVTVTQSVASVVVSPSTAELAALGETVQLTAEAFDENGLAVAGAEFSWESSDVAVATVDESGLVTGVAEGVATITASAGEASGSAVVTVMQPVASVEVSPSAETIGLGSTLQLTAEAFDENGDAVEGAAFSWESSDAAVATVDASGLVTGVTVGVATVTASAGSGQGTAEITVMDVDRAALIALYEATDGPNWVNSENWLTDAPLGDWYGVDTDAGGRVVRLDLRGRWDSDAREWIPHGLSGPVPPELGNLANLESLSLGDNDLSGPVPPELGNLANLESLSLEDNDLSGSIPAELGSLTNLGNLSLGHNELTGPVPPELGGLTKLWFLDLAGNALTGPIPTELGSLTKLRFLYLSGNDLTGPIPESFLELNALERFRFERSADLCAPGTTAFVTWLKGIETVSGPYCNESDMKVLDRLYQTSRGPSWTNASGWLETPALEEWYGVTANALGRVVTLDLTRNGLTGELPASLGSLALMTALRVGGNALSGRLPLSLAHLSLVELQYPDTGLCVPADASFRTWLDGIASHEGTGVGCAPLSDRDVLEALYHGTGGPDWFNKQNWLTGAPLRQWYGVIVGGQGRVVRLRLGGNNLQGQIPPELGNLANLTSLSLGGNELSGPIPPELGNLSSLTRLWLWSNELSGPIPPELGSLANLTSLNLFNNRLSGPIPPELGNLPRVEDLFLSSNALTGPLPPELGNLPSVVQLSLGQNNLSGPIPSELGGLATLERILLGSNNLTGPIPPELSNLANVIVLHLYNNALSGPIPGDLGRLASMEWMLLWGNDLTGSIPRELGNLANMESLSLSDNELSGPIPPELGNLSSVTYLALDGNALAGPLPGALGNLSTVEELILSSNALTGPVPPEFGDMSSLKQLALSNNPGMEGALAAELTSLRQLEALLAADTGLCVSSDPGIQAWLARVHKRRIKPCAEGDPPMAYLTQAVQSREYPVPLVAGERALLRVFPTARQATSVGIPAVRARFYVNGRETHVEDIPGKSAVIPTRVDESSLSRSANVEIPGNVVQPGLEMVIEVDPEGTLDSALGVANRIPETGRLAVDVRAMPLFDLTLIPFVWSQTQDASIVDLIGAMAADPKNHEMLWDTRTLLPVGTLDVKAHEPVLSSSNSAFAIRDETKAIRAMEGGSGHYMGMMANPVTGAGGVAFLPGRSSFALPVARIIAHELGHNMNLQHAPCGTTGDASYPYPDGSIGVWGHDFRDGGSLVRPARPDLMSYCFVDQWISDYSFTNALRYRLFDEPPPLVAATSLLLWGGMDAEGEPFLHPAFVVDAPPALPESDGPYQITGRTTSGDELFDLDFTMPEVADGDGSSSFAFVLPVEPGWAGNLASITLSGPGGSATLDSDTDLPMAILLDPSSGQVRGILRDLPQADAAAALTPQAGLDSLDVLFSRGIPDAAAWSR